MSSKGQKVYPSERRPAFVISLLLSFVITFGLACIVAYKSYTRAIDTTIRSNETKAPLLAKLILEYERAAIGVLQSYADRPDLVCKVKKRNCEETIQHLADLAKNNPEMDWPFVANLSPVQLPLSSCNPRGTNLAKHTRFQSVINR